MTRVCIYHSPQWCSLVETGWITMTVFEQDGERVARMLHVPRPRRFYGWAW